MKKPSTLAKALNKAEQAYRDQSVTKPVNRDQVWAKWCAQYLLSHDDFQAFTKRTWSQPELSQALQDLEAAYKHTSQRHHWSVYFSQRLIE